MDDVGHDLDEAVIVALGGNLPGDYGHPQALLEAALAALAAEGVEVLARSPWWRSAAWPDPADPEFCNGVALVRTDLGPGPLMTLLGRIELAFGRDRSAARNSPRPLDLDLIAHGRQVSADPRLTLPHPRAHQRLFVMGPLAQIAPSWRHPTLGATAAELAASATVGADATPI